MIDKGPGKPPKKSSVKGSPPASASEAAVVANYGERKGEGEKVPLNLSVEQGWKKDLMECALANDTKAVRIIKEAVADYYKKIGWKPSN